MKKLLLVALALLTLGSTLEVSAQKKKEKKTKAKKELKWEWDGTKSGNETIDSYLLKIDTLYNSVISYRDSIDTYQFKCDTLNLNGKIYEMAYMLNAEGRLVSQGQVNFQCVNACMDGLNLVLDMTQAGVLSATAALALPQLGLDAFKFGKYVKGGPAVISQGISTVKSIRSKWISNLRTWRALKNDALSAEEVAALGIFNEATLKKVKKCVYIKEVKPETKEYSVIVEQQKDVPQETLVVQANDAIALLDAAQMAAENEQKTLEDLGDIDKYTQDV